ncbi:MAG: ERCC4 domain-containing protein [Deltaproteobacteria bacterium]|nr:ERCC4 domain-containing protein [Deltaproteobacteria bacterium]
MTPAALAAEPARQAVEMPPVVVDSREQAPYYYPGAVVRGLKTGDYSLEGHEDQIAIERKSLSDLYGSLTWGRERFARECERLAALEYPALVIEAAWPLRPPPRSRANPRSIRATLAAWSVRYRMPVWLAGSREHAQELTFDLLRKFWKQSRAEQAAAELQALAAEVDARADALAEGLEITP